jgi:hypothetical protein
VLGGSVGEVAYLIEFGDGTAFEVVGEMLEAVVHVDPVQDKSLK